MSGNYDDIWYEFSSNLSEAALNDQLLLRLLCFLNIKDMGASTCEQSEVAIKREHTSFIGYVRDLCPTLGKSSHPEKWN